MRAWTLLETGDPAEADKLLDELLADEREHASGRFFLGHPLVLFVAHELARADAAVAWMTRPGGPDTRWLRAAEAVARDDLVGAADLYASLGHGPLESYGRFRAARAFSREGRVADAQRELKLARAGFRSTGATHFVNECEALLAALAVTT